jgi:hypothetical protein
MTQMMNLLEDYLAYRRHKHLRLDGSTTIAERRDMVAAFQSNPAIFVFLLSTRAGGLGINLTAADVVIFYESDWNPTMDLQVRPGRVVPGTGSSVVLSGLWFCFVVSKSWCRRARGAVVRL